MMRPDDFAAIAVLFVVLACTVAIAAPWLSRRNARVKQRLDLLQQALEHPQLDAQTRRQILAVLANEHQSSKLGALLSGVFWQRLVFGGAWLMFVFCGCVAFFSWSGIVPQHIGSEALVFSLMGLAVASLPFAMRELSSRQGRVAE